jgi:hypothetical protein
MFAKFILILISKVNQLRVDQRWQNPWGKGQGSESNVEDVKETICTKSALKRKAE